MSHLRQISCPDHPESALVEDYRAGDMVCPECGLVVGDRTIDVGSEWRTFSKDGKNATKNKDMSRVGDVRNPLLSGSDLSTIIQENPGQPSGSGFSSFNNRRTMSNTDRVLINAFREIASMCDRINITTEIKEAANKLFKEVYESKQLRGRSNDAISAACLYIACRQKQAPRTFKEIVAISRISKKDISKAFKLIVRNMETQVRTITTSDFVDRFCGKLELPFKLRQVAKTVAKNATEMNLVAGRSPLSVVAAAIFLVSQASKHKKSQKEIGDVAGVAEVTIRGTYKEIVMHAKKLFPPDFNFDTPPSMLMQC